MLKNDDDNAPSGDPPDQLDGLKRSDDGAKQNEQLSTLEQNHPDKPEQSKDTKIDDLPGTLEVLNLDDEKNKKGKFLGIFPQKQRC
jgi:hypothetical protein